MRTPNELIRARSPYLLQHAWNPVQWKEWSPETLALARAENKLLLVSIGYAACHWCHVMEHESFEDPGVADIMNRYFINVKVDREERPDIDQLYMDAVMLMQGQGGWPLNCIALPDGRPVFGGTYFPKHQWRDVLLQLAGIWEANPAKAMEYADRLAQGLRSLDKPLVLPPPRPWEPAQVEALCAKWEKFLDPVDGGSDHAPKFPMPDNYRFLLRAGHFLHQPQYGALATLTLDKMACGGIYDQLGGGFARYSVDRYWKVPHFEKMLYDNAQLVSLYAEAWQREAKPLYARIVAETLDWVAAEMTHPDGGFYSSLDADSEGVEGKFYVWKEAEIREALGADADLLCAFWQVEPGKAWEHGNYVLMPVSSAEDFAAAQGISAGELLDKIAAARRSLLEIRAQRIRPGLDDKVLTAWNALMIQGYVQAYRAWGRAEWLEAATRNADFLLREMWQDGRLLRVYRAGDRGVDAFLEDYACLATALTALYETTGDPERLTQAVQLTETALNLFLDPEKGMCRFAAADVLETLPGRTELSDNVTPCGNSVMAMLLYRLGRICGNTVWMELSEAMLRRMADTVLSYPGGYSHWGLLLLHHTFPAWEVAVCGPDAAAMMQEIQRAWLPQVVFAASETESSVELLRGRYTPGQTRAYVCTGMTCQAPVSRAADVLVLLRR